MMIDHQPDRHTQSSTATPLQTKFITASEVAAMNNINTNAAPEISDEELLQMALIFERKHPQ